MADEIDIGADPIERATYEEPEYTLVNKENPANASGTLHTVKIRADSNISGLIVGTFYLTNANTLKCRDSVFIGDVDVDEGEERTFPGLSIAVEAGDYIGCYFTGGTLESDYPGFAGMWFIFDNYTYPGDEDEYRFNAGYAISLYGIGDIEAPPEVGLENKSANMGSKMVAMGLI